MKTAAPQTLSYSVFYEKDSEGGFVAFVPFLPGCHTQGETLEEAEHNVREAVALYLESLRAHGELIRRKPTWNSLTYDGCLYGSNAKDSRAEHKHDIRRVFHPQLKRLWEITPQLSEFRRNTHLTMAGIQLTGMTNPKRVDVLKAHFRCDEYALVPLVTEELNLACSIEVLMLRPDKPGSLIRSGDIDNS